MRRHLIARRGVLASALPLVWQEQSALLDNRARLNLVCRPAAAATATATRLDGLVCFGQLVDQAGDLWIAEFRLYPSDVLDHAIAPNLLNELVPGTNTQGRSA